MQMTTLHLAIYFFLFDGLVCIIIYIYCDVFLMWTPLIILNIPKMYCKYLYTEFGIWYSPYVSVVKETVTLDSEMSCFVVESFVCRKSSVQRDLEKVNKQT